MLDLDTVYREEGALVYKYLCTLCRDEQLAEEFAKMIPAFILGAEAGDAM